LRWKNGPKSLIILTVFCFAEYTLEFEIIFTTVIITKRSITKLGLPPRRSQIVGGGAAWSSKCQCFSEFDTDYK